MKGFKMAGYCGYSMSVNAATAYQDYKMPGSRAIMALGLRREVLDAIDPCEWHHTSKKYNVTNFYDLRDLVAHAVLNHFSRPRPNADQLAMRAEIRATLSQEKRDELEDNREHKKLERAKAAKRKMLLSSPYAKLIRLGERCGKRTRPSTSGHAIFEFYYHLDRYFAQLPEYAFNHIYRRRPRLVEKFAEAVCWLKSNQEVA